MLNIYFWIVTKRKTRVEGGIKIKPEKKEEEGRKKEKEGEAG
jgi:hypothetical protein